MPTLDSQREMCSRAYEGVCIFHFVNKRNVFRNIYNIYSINHIQICVFSMTDSLKTKKNISTSQALPIDLSIRIKAAAWGEEDDYIKYFKDNQKKLTLT